MEAPDGANLLLRVGSVDFDRRTTDHNRHFGKAVACTNLKLTVIGTDDVRNNRETDALSRLTLIRPNTTPGYRLSQCVRYRCAVIANPEFKAVSGVRLRRKFGGRNFNSLITEFE